MTDTRRIPPAALAGASFSSAASRAGRRAASAAGCGTMCPMPTSPPKRDGRTAWIVVALALLVLYAGTYYRTVRVIPVERGGIWEWHPGYSLRAINPPPHWWDSIFAPIHWLDRGIRPEFWDPPL
jgi:hypothetical protein